MTSENLITKASSIRTSDTTKEISAALVHVQSNLKPVEKKGRNEFQNYAYAKFEDYVAAIQDVLIEAKLTTITTTGQPKRLEPRATNRGGIQYPVEVPIIMRILHSSGEWMEIDCYGEGQDSGDKGIYKAITGARKYALCCLLNLASTDDPEDDSGQKPAPDERRQQCAQGHGSRDYKANQKEKTYGGYSKNNNKSRQPLNQSDGKTEKKPPPVCKLPADEIEKIYSVTIDAINGAEDMAQLRTAFEKVYVPLFGTTRLDDLTKEKERRKLEIQKLSAQRNQPKH